MLSVEESHLSSSLRDPSLESRESPDRFECFVWLEGV